MSDVLWLHDSLQAATFEKLNAYTRAEYKTVVPSRIRFMIMDTMELMEKNHWVPRRAGPKEVLCNWRVPRSTAAPAVHRQQQEPVQRQPHAPQHVTWMVKSHFFPLPTQQKPRASILYVNSFVPSLLEKHTTKAGRRRASAN